MFRSTRFAIGEAHGRGTAVQWNWLRERGAITSSGAALEDIPVDIWPVFPAAGER